jgi:hypothetical protein
MKEKSQSCDETVRPSFLLEFGGGEGRSAKEEKLYQKS